MKSKLFCRTISLILLWGLLPACGGGGGGATIATGGGIGGTGISVTSIGPITAIGSITINDIEFQTTGSRIIFNGVEGTDESLLKLGMVVKVQGTVDESGTTGNAETVTFDNSLDGPISSISANTLVVLGQTVVTDGSTVFDDALPGGLSDLAVNDIVEISGQPDEAGNLRATRIEKESPDGEFSLMGIVLGKSGDTFLINNQTVNFALATLEGFSGPGPADGDFVKVEGSAFDPVTGDFLATKVEKKGAAFNDGEDVEAEGIVSQLNGSRFTMMTTLGPLSVQTDGTTEFQGGTPADIQIGVHLEVEGTSLADVLSAEVITF